MRVAIVGTGLMGGVHAEAWSHTDARIAAFVGTAGAGGDALAGAYAARFVTDLDAVLADVDVVDICTPTHLHAEFTLRAAPAAKHVICEKPLDIPAVGFTGPEGAAREAQHGRGADVSSSKQLPRQAAPREKTPT